MMHYLNVFQLYDHTYIVRVLDAYGRFICWFFLDDTLQIEVNTVEGLYDTTMTNNTENGCFVPYWRIPHHIRYYFDHMLKQVLSQHVRGERFGEFFVREP